MKPYEQDIWIFLTRVLTDAADSSEKKRFNEWLEEDPANRAFFEDLETRWKKEPDDNTAYRSFLFDHESGISKLRYKIREDKENNKYRAASRRATRFKRFTGWKVGASILLIIGVVSAWVGIQFWNPPVTSYKTLNMEQRIITLPDGTHVRLNNNSTLSFKKGLSGTTRKVTLKGEAFFQVKHNADKPFVIHTGNAVVRDIGTSFNVKQSSDGKIVVAMKEGEASLRDKNASSKDATILTKNHVGILSNGKASSFKQENIANYLSWVNGRIVFKEMRLDKVIRQLDNIYGIHSSLADSSLAALQLTAYTNKTSLDEVLGMIALSLDIDYRKEGQKVIWIEKKILSRKYPQNINDTTVTKD